jgi:hypothetical protein
VGDGPNRQRIDSEPLSLAQGYLLIDRGMVAQVSIGKTGAIDEYSLLLPGEGDGTEFTWKINGLDVQLFRLGRQNGLPILSDDGHSMGLTPTQLDDLLKHVKRYNATAAVGIQVVDQRE